MPAPDLPAARGVSAAERNALAYAVWAYSSTTDPVTAAALALVVHGISGDDHASPDIASMAMSNAAVKARAIQIAAEARAHAFWVSPNPWKVTITLQHVSGDRWRATTTVTTAAGRPVADHRVGLVPYNVTESPGTEHVARTDTAGRITTTWTTADRTRPVVLDAQTAAPSYYSVWKGPNYASGSVPQRVITANGTIHRGHAQHRLPTGQVQVLKTTDNPAYQPATGATFDVTTPESSVSRGTLTVGANGSSNVATLPVGTYVVTETAAPAGVTVDATPRRVAITEGTRATLTVTDAVERRAGVQLIKVDAVTGEPLAGARLLVEYDTDDDGTYESPIGTFTSDTTPVDVPSMKAGNYRITEVAAPPGYELAAETTQEVSIGWDQTAVVTFADHQSVVVITQAQLIGDEDTESSDADAPTVSTFESAHVVAPIGHHLGDAVSITGLAPGETAAVTVSLYGPVAPDATPVCDADHRVFTDSWDTTGSGTTTSGTFTPTVIGHYTWVATVDVPGLGSVSGPCGEVGESAVLTPTIATVAKTPEPIEATEPPDSPETTDTSDPDVTAESTASPAGTSVTDEITVNGVAPGTGIRVDTALYGPFPSVDALAEACAERRLGEPVGTVSDTFTSGDASTVVESSPITMPADGGEGHYTFVATLAVPGFPPAGHACGAETETFDLAAPPTTTTTTVPDETTTTSTASTVPDAATTTAAPTTSVPPTTAIPSTVPPSTAPPVTAPPSTATATPPSAPPAPIHSEATGHGSTSALPATGAPVDRLVGYGTALALTGIALLLLVARHRLATRP